jgi:nucleoside-diphosphate-sugar epimerase
VTSPTHEDLPGQRLFHPLEIGGAEKAARRLAENLAARGWEVVALTIWPRDENLILPSGVKVCRIRPGAVFFKDGSADHGIP